MCGVFAAWLTHGDLSPTQVRRALNCLAHRGPDGEGIWIADNGRVALGHRRLSVIALADGAQPIANEDETIRVTVNGEFYGFETIRRDLQRRGHCFRTQSDSEIVLHLYEEHGAECLKFLRGEFAFVLWDARAGRLFAARDRFGVKPLCYVRDGNGIRLASEAKALFAAGHYPAWDHESFFYVSAMQYVLPDRTLFEGVRQLPAAHFLEADASGVRILGYWDLESPPLLKSDLYSESIPIGADASRLICECRDRVVDAVQCRLRSDVPLCCHLSGGLDSTTIAAVASQSMGRPIDAFVMSFEVEGYDELARARDAARSSIANLHVVSISQDDLLNHFDESVMASEGLAINGHLPAKFLLHRTIKEHGYKVVLTGEGADEAFAGYAHLRQDQWRLLGSQELVRALTATNQTSLGMMLPFGPSLPLDQVRRRLGFVPTYFEAKASLGSRVQSLLHDDWLAQFQGRDAYSELVDSTAAIARVGNCHPVNQSTWLWSKTALANYILRTLGDGTEMPSSVEGRVPLLDHHLFEFLRGVPVGLKIRGPTEKYILREAIKPFVPIDVYRREKHPLDAPPLSLFSSRAGNTYLRDRLLDSSCYRQPFFSPTKCARLLDALPQLDNAQRQAWDPALMTVLSTTAMQRLLEVRQ